MRKLLYSFLFFIFLQFTTFGQKTFDGSSNNDWNTTANWTPSGVPTGTDNVLIPAGFTVNVSGTAICSNLTIASTSTLNIPNNTFTVNGTTSISGTLNHTAGGTNARTFIGTVTVNSGGAWNNSGNSPVFYRGGISNNGNFTSGTGVQTFNTNAQAIYGNININSITVTVVTLSNNGVLTIPTTLTGSGTVTNISGSTLTIGGTSSITNFNNGGTTNIGGTGAVSTVLANFINTGTLNLGGTGNITGITNNAGGTVNLADSGTIANFNNATATSVLQITDANTNITTLTATVAGNTVNYNGVTQVIKGTTYSNLIVSGSGVKTLSAATTTNATLTLNNNTSLNMSTFALTLNGNLINNGSGAITGTTGGVNISGGNTQNIAGFTTTGIVNINKTGGTVATLTGNVNGGGLTMTSGTLSLSSNLVHTFSGNWVRSGGTLNGGSSNLKIGGNVTGNSGTFNAGTSTFDFNRSGAQNLGPSSLTFYNLIFSGSGAKTVASTTNVTNLWSFTDTASADLPSNLEHTTAMLTLGGAGPLTSTWGSTASNPVATNTTNTYFSNSGRIRVTGSVTSDPPIDNNYATYSNGNSGQVFGSSGEYANPPTNTIAGSVTLTAPSGTIFNNVKFASYGSPGGTAPNFTIGSCHAFNSRTVTTGLLGNTTATIPASGTFNDTFGDPCYGVVKSYNVVATYSEPFCTTSPVPALFIDGSKPTGGNGTYNFYWEVSTSGHSTGYGPAPGVNDAEDYTVASGTTTTTWYRRTVTSGVYSDATIVIVQVVKVPPTAPTSVSGAGTVCAGGSRTLTAIGGATGGPGGYAEWTTGSCGGTVIGTGVSITVYPTADTTYYVRYRNSCGDSSCASATVSNLTSITLTPSTINSATCRSNTLTNLPISYSARGGSPTSYSIVWSPAAISAGFANKTDVPFSFTPTTGTITNAINVPANVIAATYTATFTVKSGTCVSFAKAISVIVNPKPTSVVSGTKTICNGENATISVTFTGTAPWNITYTDGSTTGSFSTSSNPYIVDVSPTTNSTYAITALSDANCSASTADMTGNAVITVKQIQATPTILDKTNSDCEALGTVTLGNLTASGWTINQTGPGSATSTITGTGTSRQITGLAVGNYTFTVITPTTCASAATPSQTISDNSSTTWTGSGWSQGIPDSTKRIIIASNTGTPFPSTTPIVNGCSLTIDAGINVTIPKEVTLVITNAVTTNGQLTFESESSLQQIADVANTGEIRYRRKITVRRYDLTYWSNPLTKAVGNFTMHDLSPDTLLDKYFTYDTTLGWITDLNGTLPMKKGIGYSIRAPQPFNTDVAADFTGEFVGVPNNGNIDITAVSGKFNLVGNPYPSAMSANAFILGNPGIGTLYFWTHNSLPTQSKPGDTSYYYGSADFAAYNLSGPAGGATLNGQYFEGFIAAGQGFLAKAPTTTVHYNNSMRRSAHNSQFYKNANADNLERNRVWLSLANTEGVYKQMLVGYIEGATNSIDNDYDAVTMSSNTYIDFYSISESKKLTIQGRALPFVNTDVIPLGYKSTIAGEFTISIENADGLFTNQEVYLEDLTRGKIINLRTENYKFTTEIGTFTNRFNLRYTSKTLRNEDFENLENSILVSVKNKVVKVNSSKELIKDVSVYNIGAQLLYTKNKIDSSELVISNLNSSDQVLLVKVTLENGYSFNKKVIFSNL